MAFSRSFLCRLLCGASLFFFVMGSFVVGSTTTASADFRACNKTGSRVGIAIGLRDDKGWKSEGWWNLNPRSCEILIKGTLVSRFYYAHAVDYDQGGEWGGRYFLCTSSKTFDIRGIDNCQSRGFERTGFFEIDTGDQKTWTVQLTNTDMKPGQGEP